MALASSWICLSDPRPVSDPLILHANCVELDGKGLLITGVSGSGKSDLSLQLMGLGATLVADDRVVLTNRYDALYATAPDTTAGLIEARGIGILRASHVAVAKITAEVDLDNQEESRHPPERKVTHLGCEIPLFYRPAAIHSASAFLQLLRCGRSDR